MVTLFCRLHSWSFGEWQLPLFPQIWVLTNKWFTVMLAHYKVSLSLSALLPYTSHPAWMCWPLWQPSNSDLINLAHLPGTRAAPGAILQMCDLQVPPGHGDLLVGICSSADDILKGILLLRDLCASQSNSESLCLEWLSKGQWLTPCHRPAGPAQEIQVRPFPPQSSDAVSKSSDSPPIANWDLTPSLGRGLSCRR